MKHRAASAAAVVAGFSVFFALFFWPVLGHGLIFGDAVDQLIEALPMYLGGHPFWQPLTTLGLPYTANPLSVTWYPPAALRFVPGSFDVYEVSAYVIAACGAFGLARAVTRSTTGAVVAGLVYALSGFMIGHAGHIGLIHPAAWVPWVFWGLVALRDDGRASRIAGVALAYALVVLGGAPDIAIYTVYAMAAYVLVARSWRFAVQALAAAALAVAIAAIALVPGFEIALASVRTQLTLEQHAGFAVPLAALPFRLFFPYLLGQTTLAPYAQSAWNLGSFAETTDYVGLTTLVLAAAGATARNGVRVGFWIGLFVVALVLSTGNDLGLATVTYHLPGLNWMRAPGRYAFEVALAACVLAAAGVAAIERGAAGPRRIAACVAAVAATAAVLLAIVAIFGRDLAAELGRDFGLGAVAPEAIDPLRNAALWLPPATLVAGCAALAVFTRRPRAAATRALLACATALDLAGFAWFGYWNFGAFPPSRLDPPAYVAALRASTAVEEQRVLGVPSLDAGAGVAPNLNVLWNLAGVRGYSNLALERTAALLRVDSTATLRDVLAADDRALDAAGVRYAVVPRAIAPVRALADPFDPDTALGVRVASGAGDVARRTSFDLPAPVPVTRIALVSFLARNPGIADGTVVADVRVVDGDGRSASAAVRAGAGPSRTDLLTLTRPLVARRIEIVARGGAASGSVLDIERLSLLDDRTQTAVPLTALTYLNDAPQRWRPIPNGDGDRIFENVRAFARAWIVHRAIAVDDAEALAEAVEHRWTPAQVALIGGRAPALVAPEPGAVESVRVTALAPERMDLDVDCATSCAVVTSDAPYPGWSARVDERSVPILRADYAFRAVAVPAGRHRVAFAFTPWSTYAGAAISLAALLVALWLCAGLRRARVQA